MTTTPLTWTTTPPIAPGFYWAQTADGDVTIVEWHAGSPPLVTEMGSPFETLAASYWARFSDRRIPWPEEPTGPLHPLKEDGWNHRRTPRAGSRSRINSPRWVPGS